jgi:tetratricopeptide (TPR) repeat protein
MKRLAFFLSCLVMLQGFTQQPLIDSLKKKLATEKNDTARANLLYDIGYAYRFFDYDSSIYYGRQLINLSKPRFPLGEMRGYFLAGNGLRYAGNYTGAIEFFLKGLQLAEIKNLPAEKYHNLQGISLVYKDMGDYQQAFDYGFQASALANNVPDGRTIATGNLGDLYERTNRLDSALYFENMAYEESVKTGSNYGKAFTLETLGRIHEKLGNRKLAIEYLMLSIEHAHAGNLMRELSEASNTLAAIYLKEDKYDSVYKYVQASIQAGKDAPYKLGIFNASRILGQYFEEKRKADSALAYYKMAVATRNEIMNDEKLRQIENLQFNEQLRQQELAEQAAQERHHRLVVLQVLGIALFIIFFFTVVLLLSRWKISATVMEFLLIIMLLLIFEFINLLIHPLVGSFTDHQPVFMLLVLVCVGAILVPAHHKLEKWMKSRLASRPEEV